MKKVVATYTCDMCGVEFDPYEGDARQRSMVRRDIVVFDHDPSFIEEYQYELSYMTIDLCPTCADRAVTIHREWYEDEGGESHSKLLWRDTRHDGGEDACDDRT